MWRNKKKKNFFRKFIANKCLSLMTSLEKRNKKKTSFIVFNIWLWARNVWKETTKAKISLLFARKSCNLKVSHTLKNYFFQWNTAYVSLYACNVREWMRYWLFFSSSFSLLTIAKIAPDRYYRFVFSIVHRKTVDTYVLTWFIW